MTQVLHWALEYRALPLVLIGLVLAGLSLLMSEQHLARIASGAGCVALVPLVGFALLAWQFGAQRHRSVFARSRL